MKSQNGSLNYLSFVLEARKRGREEESGEGRRGGGGKNVIFVFSSRVCIYVCMYVCVRARVCVNIEEQQGITRLLQRGWKTMLVRQINGGGEQPQHGFEFS